MPHLPFRRRLLPALAAVAATGLTAPAAHAVTWTPVASGTTSEITAIEYQGPTRLWFATANGDIYTRQADGSFARTYDDASDRRLTDIQFNSAGTGIAVGAAGAVIRSTNNGASWTPIVTGNHFSKPDGGCNAPDGPLGDVNHVRFASDSRVWLFGQGSQLGLSNDGGASWANANRKSDGDGNVANDVCRIDGTGYFYASDGLADGYFPTADTGYVVAGFETVLFSGTTTDGATSFARKSARAGNSFSGRTVLAGGDPSNSGRMWATDPGAYGISQTAWTEDGWQTSDRWQIANPTARTFPANGPADVEYAGGTVLAAGDAGLILSSTDGRNFSYVDAPAFATASWRAVGLASATQGAVGGTGGTLLLTDDANALPAPVTATPAPGGGTPTPTPSGGTTKPPTLPAPTLASKTSPPLAGKAAKVVGKNVVFRVKGRLGLPKGLSRKAACKGTMSISVYKGKKRLKDKTVKVDRKCGYKTTVKVKRSKVGRKTRKLKLKVAFRGNAVLGKLSSTYNVRVKRR